MLIHGPAGISLTRTVPLRGRRAGSPSLQVPGRLHGPSLHRLAKLTITESDRGMRLVPYQENTRFPVQGRVKDAAEPVGAYPPYPLAGRGGSASDGWMSWAPK
jgi:hypothetical protein